MYSDYIINNGVISGSKALIINNKEDFIHLNFTNFGGATFGNANYILTLSGVTYTTFAVKDLSKTLSCRYINIEDINNGSNPIVITADGNTILSDSLTVDKPTEGGSVVSFEQTITEGEKVVI